MFAPRDEGEDPRHVDSIWPIWSVLDMTPEGRAAGWDFPQLNYEWTAQPLRTVRSPRFPAQLDGRLGRERSRDHRMASELDGGAAARQCGVRIARQCLTTRAEARS
jgi:hypothetical protein